MNMRIQFDTVFVNEEPAARIMIGEIRGNLVNIETYLLENKIKDNFKWYKVEFEHRLRKTLEMSSSFIQGKQIQIVYKNQSELTEVNDENRERITMNEGSVMDVENNIHAGEYLARAGRSYAVAIVVPIITTLFGALLFTTIGTTATFVVTGIGSIVGLVAHLDGSQNLVMAGKKFQRMDAK
jgi:hypothetical protein